MKIVEAQAWLEAHPQFQTESQWAYVMRMLTGYGRAIEQAARRETMSLLTNDAYAASFQTMGQYRSALIRALMRKGNDIAL